jgi:3-deoxy-D-manno-octulosonic-acid transferase
VSTETITVTNYTPDRFQRLEATLNEHGLKFTNDSGEVKDFGADVKFLYSAISQTLTLIVLHGPHLHNFDAFCKQLEEYVTSQT